MTSVPETLHVVGQRRDGSYETFDLLVPDGEGLDAAAEACASRKLVYIHCSRPKPTARLVDAFAASLREDQSRKILSTLDGEQAKTLETARLVAELEDLPEYRGWRFTYEYPGYFCYSQGRYSVFFTPDWERDETLDIQVQVDDGQEFPGYGDVLPLPREGRSGQKLFEMVRPTLDKILQEVRP